jgi:hypothetical protein
MIVFEIQDVADVGPAPAVDRLILVAHHGDAAGAVGQEAHEAVLHVVGVLELVHEHVIEKLGQGGAAGQSALHSVERREQQAAEVDGAGGAEALFVQGGRPCPPPRRNSRPRDTGRAGALVLRAIDHGEHLAHGKGLLGHLHVGQHARHQSARIVVVVDDEFLANANGRRRIGAAGARRCRGRCPATCRGCRGRGRRTVSRRAL